MFKTNLLLKKKKFNFSKFSFIYKLIYHYRLNITTKFKYKYKKCIIHNLITSEHRAYYQNNYLNN